MRFGQGSELLRGTENLVIVVYMRFEKSTGPFFVCLLKIPDLLEQ